ncbi:MAG: hypothetical protein ACOZEN_12920 [Thermodesulfobacteriota bacterium]
MLETLRGLLGNSGQAGHSGSEVALTSCALEEVDQAGCRRVVTGEELCLEMDGERVAARDGKTVVGYLPGKDAKSVASLIGKGAGLACRVVHADRSTPEVRVRICIRI